MAAFQLSFCHSVRFPNQGEHVGAEHGGSDCQAPFNAPERGILQFSVRRWSCHSRGRIRIHSSTSRTEYDEKDPAGLLVNIVYVGSVS